MKKVKNIKSFKTGIFSTILTFVCFGALCFSNFELRLLLAGIITLIWSITSFIEAFSGKMVV